MIRVEYVNTFEEFRDAQRANGMILISRGSLGWFATLGLLHAFITRSQYLVPEGLPPTGLMPSLVRLAIFLAPNLLIVSIIVGMILIRYRNLRNPREPSYLTSAVGWILWAALASLHLRVAMSMSAESSSSSSLAGALLPPLIWCGAYVLIGAVMARHLRSTFRRIWDGDTTLQRPKVLEATERSVIVSDVFTRSETLWAGVSHVRETPNLVLVYLAKLRFYFVPKHAFPDPADVKAFVEFVAARLGGVPGGGFEVESIPQAPETVPVQPLADATSRA